MDRIYDAAQQGVMACVTASEPEESLYHFLAELLASGTWSPHDISLVELEIRRLLALGKRDPGRPILRFRKQVEPVAPLKSNRTAPGA